jgi:hypothetical protein
MREQTIITIIGATIFYSVPLYNYIYIKNKNKKKMVLISNKTDTKKL